jgi:hypothetical protein
LRVKRSPARPAFHMSKTDAMKELLRTNNTVRLAWLQALLSDSGIESVVLDHHTSLIEGSIGAIPQRLMVSDRDLSRARALLSEAGESTR